VARGRFRRQRADSFDRFHNWLDHQHHSGTAPIGPVVDLMMFSLGPIAKVMEPHGDKRLLDCLVQQALSQVTGENLREECQDFKLHRSDSVE